MSKYITALAQPPRINHGLVIAPRLNQVRKYITARQDGELIFHGTCRQQFRGIRGSGFSFKDIYLVYKQVFPDLVISKPCSIRPKAIPVSTRRSKDASIAGIKCFRPVSHPLLLLQLVCLLRQRKSGMSRGGSRATGMLPSLALPRRTLLLHAGCTIFRLRDNSLQHVVTVLAGLDFLVEVGLPLIASSQPRSP